MGSGLIMDLKPGHAHWVNTMTLNTSHTIRNCLVDADTLKLEKLSRPDLANRVKVQKIAEKNYHKAIKMMGREIMASGSDDNTIILWNVRSETPQVKRLVGHKNAINHLLFSPNG